LLYANVALSVIAIISGGMEFAFLVAAERGDFVDMQEIMRAANASDTRQQIIGIVQLFMIVALAVAVLCWIYRANSNARALGAASMRFTPGWAVGWYFIPIFNLWKPYQAMKEIWRASANPPDWQSQGRSPLLPWWWFLWIVTILLSQAFF
jgi:hypothetical protein